MTFGAQQCHKTLVVLRKLKTKRRVIVRFRFVGNIVYDGSENDDDAAILDPGNLSAVSKNNNNNVKLMAIARLK